MLHRDKIYRMMDHLDSEKVKALVCKATMGLLHEKVRVMFYDTTTLYFESFADDDFRKSGFSKDGKSKENQVVLALITTVEFVADRGMSSQKNIAALEKHGLRYVLAAKLRSMDRATQESVLAVRTQGRSCRCPHKKRTVYRLLTFHV